MITKIGFGFAVISAIFIFVSVGVTQNREPCSRDPEGDAFCGPAGCKEFDFRGVSFRVPKYLVIQNTKGYEGTGLASDHDEFLLLIDGHPDAGRPTFERRLESFRDEVVIVGEVRYWRWELGEWGDWKHSIGVNVWDDSKNTYAASVVFLTKSSEHVALGKGIISSVCYKGN